MFVFIFLFGVMDVVIVLRKHLEYFTFDALLEFFVC